MAVIGLKIRLHNLNTIPTAINPAIQTASTLNVCATTLLIDKKISEMHTQATIIDRMLITSFISPFLNPFFTLHAAIRTAISIKIIFKSTVNTFLKHVKYKYILSYYFNSTVSMESAVINVYLYAEEPGIKEYTALSK